MEGFWPIFFLAVVLKIPVAAMLWLVWWAIRATPAPDAPPENGDGGFGRFRRPPRPPRGPRRGPHAPGSLPLPDCPPGARTRVLTPPAPVRASRAHGAERGTSEPVPDRL